MRRFPDWLLYLLVLGALLWVLGRVGQQSDAPPAPPMMEEGPLLPGPTPFDPEVLVDVGPITSGVGTAFAIDKAGWWLTARHVVDECTRVGLVIGRGRAVQTEEVLVARFADLALLRTKSAPAALAVLSDESQFRIGQTAFHMGFPQGQPGEAASRLLGRETLIARGRYELEEPVLAWAEVGRTQGLRGTLAGMSGGPVFDGEGRVIGVTVAESARRGRIYTAAPTTIAQLLQLHNLSPAGEPSKALTLQNYGPEADRLRRELAVAQIVCVTDER